MRLLYFALAGLVLATLVPIAMLYALQDRMMFPAPRLERMPEYPAGFAEVSIPTPDGERLFALHKPPARNDAPTIIVFHGNADAAVFQHAKADTLSRAGFGVLLAEYRGYPGSTGRPSEAGLFVDARAAYDFLSTRFEGDIGLYGHSLGAAVAVDLATEREVYALVLESPFDSMLALAHRYYPWVPAKEVLLRHHFRADLAIAAVNAPILMIHGADDRIVPPIHGRRLAERAPSDTEFLEIAGAGHNDLIRFGSLERAVAFFAGRSPASR